MEMLNIEIIGLNTESRRLLENNVCTAVAKLGVPAKVNCNSDLGEINRRRLKCTPALIVNGQIISQGKILASKQIQSLLLESIG
jgi:hypothetical protein